MKKILLSIVASFVFFAAIAVPIKSGTYAVTAGSTNNVQLTDLSFVTVNSIGSAVALLNANGVELLGTVRFQFAAGYTETASSQYDIGSAGSAIFTNPYTQVYFEKIGVGANPVLTASTTGSNSSADFILRLNGADNITFDGIDFIENTANVMTASTTAATTAAPMEYGVHIRNSGTNPAQNNTIKNCTITLYNFVSSSSTRSSVNTYGIYQLSDVAGALNSGNVYDNVNITKSYKGIVINGMPGNEDIGCVVKNCTIGGAGAGDIGGASTTYGGAADVFGVRVVSQQDFIFSNNTVQNAQFARTGSSGIVYGVFLSATTGTCTVNNNKVYKIVSQRTGSSSGSPSAGLEIEPASGITNVYNNMIGSIQSSASATGTFMLYGIRIQGAGTVNLYHNSVSLPNIAGSGQCSSASLYTTSFAGTINAQDNMLSNAVVIASGSAKAYCFYLGSGTIGSSNYNILDITASGSRYTGNYLGTDKQTLALWQGVAGEANSKQFTIPYLSTTDLHLNLAAPNPVYTGIFITSPSITTDIDGETRVNPFIGADEKIFTLAPQVFISNNNPDDSLVAFSSTNNLLAGIALNVSGVSNTLTGITFSTSGFYTSTAGAIDFTNVTLWYSSSPVFSPATSTVLNNTTYVTTMPAAGTNNLPFTFPALTLPLGATYIYVTFNVNTPPPSAATAGHNVRVGSTPFSNIVFGVSGTTKIGTDPIPQGGLQVIAQYYYNKPNLDITLEANWYENVSGFAQPPTNFTDPNQVFVFIANTGATMGLETALPSWNVSGANTKIIVGDGINPITFEAKLPVVTGASVVMDIKDKGIVKFQSSYIPTALGALAPATVSTIGSTVEYGDSSVTVTVDTILTASYCNLTLSGTTTGGAKRNFVSNISVSRAFTTGGFPGATLGVITFNGGIVTQTIPSGFIFRGLRVNNSIGATTLAGNVQVDSLLRFTTNLNVAAGQTLTLGINAKVFAPFTSPTNETGKLTLTGTGVGAIAALTNTNPLINTFLGTASTTNPYIVFGPYSNYNLSATLSSTANNYGQIPPATWDVNSTINITNVTTAGANNIVIGQPASFVFGNITFDAPALAADYRLFGGLDNTNSGGAGTVLTPWTVNLLGNLTLGRTNGFTVDLGAGSSTESYTMTVAKKLIQSDGIYRLLNSTTTTQKAFLTISDDITLSNGTQLILDGPLAGSTATLNVGANFTANSGTTVTEGASGVLNKIVFTKAGTQIFTTNGANFNNDINYIVNNGSTAQLGTSSNLTVNGGAYISLLTGGIFDIAASNTLTVNGTVTTGGSNLGTISGSSTSNLAFGGTGNSSIGTIYFTSAGTAALNNLTFNRAGTTPFVLMGGTTGLTVNGTLTIGTGNANNTIDMGVNALAAGGSFATNISTANTATLKTQNTTSTPIPTGKTWGGTVWYSSASPQTMVDGSFTNINGTGGNRTLSSTGTIGIAGANTCFTTGAGSYTVTGSTVDFNGSANQNIPAFTFENVISSNGATTKTLVGNIAVQESITLSNTTTLQLANFNLSLLSTATKTARLNPVTTAATIAYSGTGLAYPQRYLPARRSWRLMTAPLNPAAGTHTISQAWQEGQTNYATDSVNVPVNGGFATQITGGTTGNGFDQGSANSSIKYFNAGTWVPAANTNVLSVNSKEGWFLFVRGDRKNFGLITNQYKTPTATTLRPRGQLFIGTKSVTSSGLTVVGNPYASAVDYNSMIRTGIGWPANPTYYMWDPYLGGATGQGAFITLTWNGSNFTRSAPLSGSGTSTLDNRYIPSGAAILVDFPAGGGTLTFNETDKNAANTTLAFRQASNQMMTILNTVTADGDTYISDGTLSLFDDRFSNETDINDANKLSNTAEGFSIKRDGKYLSVERRKLIAASDTIFYNLAKMQLKKYQLQFVLDQMQVPASTVAFLEDTYLKKKMPVSMQDTSRVEFTVTADAGSYAADRFRLVFKKSVAYTSISAAVLNSDIAVNWHQADELNINHYEIERSADAVNFTVAGTKISTGNSNTPVSYDWIDPTPAPGLYYYRIKSVSNNGVITYSDNAKVRIAKGSPALYVFPNPVTDGNIQLQLNNAAAGLYSTRLLGTNGQVIYKEVIAHAGGTATHVIRPLNYLNNSTYQLEVTAPDKKITVIQIAVNKN